MIKCLGIMGLLAPLCAAGAGAAYPLTTNGNHFIVDAAGKPFFLIGDSPWYISECLSASNVDYYLSNRWAQGYNGVLLDVTAQAGEDLLNDDTNYYGQHPFTSQSGGYTNLGSWNVRYFTNLDYVIQDAAKYGICCFCYPLYDGYGAVNWYDQMAGNSPTTISNFGWFIGSRYSSYSNIVWVGAGDYDEPQTNGKCLWDYLANGLTNADHNHLLSAQPVRQTPATYYDFISLNATYPACFSYIQSLANYQASPTLASFLREPYYAGPFATCSLPQCSDLNERQFAYWAAFCGESGCFVSAAIYAYFPGIQGSDGLWTTNLVCNISLDFPNLGKLFNSRNWTNFVPDAGHTVVTSGYGTSGAIDYITTVRESHGYTLMSYIPQDKMAPTVAMNQLAGATANAWWYNPSNGVATLIGTYPTTGTQTFTPASTNDWVLVLDDAAQNYPPPGQSNEPPPEPLQITPAAGFISTGPFGGPFSITNQNLTLTNIGSASLNWALSNSSPWLSASTNGGTLTPGGAAAVVSVSLSPGATNLGVGVYTNTVWFTNVADGVSQGVQFKLNVTQAAPILIWSNPPVLAYGAGLTSNQLDATANVPGSFAYNPNFGAVPGVGTDTLLVVFTPADRIDYNSATDSVSLLVLLAPISLNTHLASNVFVLSWSDPASHFLLQGAPALNGGFTNLPGAESPYSNVLTGAQRYFRLMAQ